MTLAPLAQEALRALDRVAAAGIGVRVAEDDLFGRAAQRLLQRVHLCIRTRSTVTGW